MSRVKESKSSLMDDMGELGSLLEGQLESSAQEDTPSDGDAHSEVSAAPASATSASATSESATKKSKMKRPDEKKPDAEPSNAEPSDEEPSDARTPAKEDSANEDPAASGSNGTSSWTYLGQSTFQDARGQQWKRSQFFIRPDQHKAISMLSALNSPLGSSRSEVAATSFDLLGMNGMLGVPGLTAPRGVPIPDRLIEECQWQHLMQAATELCEAEWEEAVSDTETNVEELSARVLSVVAYLVQDALYEAGYGDGRRRRSTPPL